MNSRRRGSLSFLETTIDSASATRSGAASVLDVTTTRQGMEATTIHEGEGIQEGREE